MTSTTNRRKILIPLATLLAAGAVAVGSGATFTSTSVSSSAVTAGNLVHTNSRDGLSMNVANIKPGDIDLRHASRSATPAPSTPR